MHYRKQPFANACVLILNLNIRVDLWYAIPCLFLVFAVVIDKNSKQLLDFL